MTAVISFDKVEQGQSLSFEKGSSTEIKNITINLNWGKYKPNPSARVDIDLALAMLTGETNEVKKGFFKNLLGGSSSSSNLAHFVHCFDRFCAQRIGTEHMGDDTSGSWTEGEFIEIDVTKLPSNITSLIPSILSYSGHALKDLEFAYMKVYAGTAENLERPLFEVDLKNLDASVMSAQFGRLVRNGASWKWTTDLKYGDTRGTGGFTQLKKMAVN